MGGVDHNQQFGVWTQPLLALSLRQSLPLSMRPACSVDGAPWDVQRVWCVCVCMVTWATCLMDLSPNSCVSLGCTRHERTLPRSLLHVPTPNTHTSASCCRVYVLHMHSRPLSRVPYRSGRTWFYFLPLVDFSVDCASRHKKPAQEHGGKTQHTRSGTTSF
jgi:hypothetical protein